MIEKLLKITGSLLLIEIIITSIYLLLTHDISIMLCASTIITITFILLILLMEVYEFIEYRRKEDGK